MKRFTTSRNSLSLALIMVSIISLKSLTINAQNHYCPDHFRIGFNANAYVNGNGHGGFYNLGLVLNSHASTLSLGANFQKAKSEFNGLGLTYSFNVVGANASCKGEGSQFNEREELNFFCTINYYKNAVLSTSTINAEGKLQDDLSLRYKSLQLNTVEAFGGLGYIFLISHNIKLRSYIGIGVYSHLNFNEPMFHNKMATVLMTGIGIGFIK